MLCFHFHLIQSIYFPCDFWPIGFLVLFFDFQLLRDFPEIFWLLVSKSTWSENILLFPTFYIRHLFYGLERGFRDRSVCASVFRCCPVECSVNAK